MQLFAAVGGKSLFDEMYLLQTMATYLDAVSLAHLQETCTSSYVSMKSIAWKDVWVDRDDASKIIPTFISSLQSFDMAELLSRMNTTVFFDWASTNIFSESLPDMEVLLCAMHQFPMLEVVLIGHCGIELQTHVANAFALSRAESIRDLLVATGVSRNRISVLSAGKSQVINISVGEDAWVNRRVEFKFHLNCSYIHPEASYVRYDCTTMSSSVLDELRMTELTHRVSDQTLVEDEDGNVFSMPILTFA